jgi:PAS domain S-box-containing protein
MRRLWERAGEAWLRLRIIFDRAPAQSFPVSQQSGFDEMVASMSCPVIVGETRERAITSWIGAAHIAPDALKQTLAERQFELAFESCPNGMAMINGAGRLMMVNAELERMFGYRRTELIGEPLELLVPERPHNRHVQCGGGFERHTPNSQTGSAPDVFGRRRDGTELAIQFDRKLVRHAEHDFELCVIVDVTDRRRLERLADEFVATVSHELRTPITSIYGSLTLLVNNAGNKSPDSTARLLAIAHASCQRLVRLVNDLLDIQKLQSGKSVFNLERVDVRSLIEHAIDSIRGLAEGCGVRIRLDAESADGEVRADPDRLTQVFTNLLSNAIKFSPPDADVLVALERRADCICISVRDRGPGIPAEFRTRIFDRFAQAESTNTRQDRGTGLGLSIVKEIVTRLGGQVGFVDAPGNGSIFYVELPCLGQDSAAESDTSPLRRTVGR